MPFDRPSLRSIGFNPTMRLPLYQVDAFADGVFAGNPAAVCPLETWLSDATLQAIAAENNLSETAFLARSGSLQQGDYALRWFTPTVEVDLCGHATLAAAHVIFNFIDPQRRQVSFHALKAGTLTVSRRADWLVMDFPARPAVPAEPPTGLISALGITPQEVLRARDHLLVYRNAEEVRSLSPDMAALAAVNSWAVIATAPGDNGVDFVSRFFAPRQGVAEDPVTGSAHCTLAPYWSKRLGKTELDARQISKRGGALHCTLDGERVAIAGKAALYFEGQIFL
jgi:PhzF family phenazine biosynthesis protein